MNLNICAENQDTHTQTDVDTNTNKPYFFLSNDIFMLANRARLPVTFRHQPFYIRLQKNNLYGTQCSDSVDRNVVVRAMYVCVYGLVFVCEGVKALSLV